MSELKNKSCENAKAACILNKNGLYSSSIHCSYYSCYQLMEHFLLDFKTEFEKYKKDTKKKAHHLLRINFFFKIILKQLFFTKK